MYDVWKEKRERSILSLYNKRNIKLLDESIENTRNIHNWQCLICNYVWKTSMNNIISSTYISQCNNSQINIDIFVTRGKKS